MENLLQDPVYSKIRDPTSKIKTKLNKSIKESSIEEDMKRQFICQDPRPPLLYGLPKIHKSSIPMRPIVSAIGSISHKIARYLAEKSNPTGKTDSFIKNSFHFVEKLKSLRIQNEDLLVSFDVVSLFTNIPIADTIQLIKKVIPEDKAKLVEICLKSTYFQYNGEFYQQNDGSPMGSPLSPVAANLFMEDFEEKALESANLKPVCWWRYVDDVFLIWRHGLDTLNDLLQHMNSVNPKIQFTMEIEKEGVLPFLDVLANRKPDGTVGHKVYRKPTHTNRYLNAHSHHYPAQKQAVIKSLVTRGYQVSDSESWAEEKLHLTQTLKKNGFEVKLIKKTISQQENNSNRTREPREPAPLPIKKAFLPYIKGTTDKISTLLRKHEISTVFTTDRTTKQLLGSVKDPLPLKTCGVYEIPCSCGKSYIGQTGRLVSTRLQEHIRAVKNEDWKSAIAEHSKETKHLINFEDTKVLASIPYYHNRIIREAIEIEKNKNNFNRDDGLKLSRTWKPLISKLPKRFENNTQVNTVITEPDHPARPTQRGPPTPPGEDRTSYNLRPRRQYNHPEKQSTTSSRVTSSKEQP